MTGNLQRLAKHVGEKLVQQNWLLTTAESCTGGWVAHIITDIPGSSQWYERGFVTYSNAAKQEMLGVQTETLMLYGAVSEQTAKEMAEGALHRSHAQVSLAITGIAGPEGGSTEKPVGLVWFAWAGKHIPTQAAKKYFSGDRQSIRKQAVDLVLRELLLKI